jgi:hypothetical protein
MEATVPLLATLLMLPLCTAPAGGSLTVEGGAGWELTFHEPVIAGGRLNTTLLRLSNGTRVCHEGPQGAIFGPHAGRS